MKHLPQTQLIAALYLDAYAYQHGLERPLLPDQVRQAGAIFTGFLFTRELAELYERERVSPKIDYADLVMAFLTKIRTNQNQSGYLGYDQVKLMTDCFLNEVMSMDYQAAPESNTTAKPTKKSRKITNS